MTEREKLEPSNRIRETQNEYGTPVVEYRCGTCGVLFTLCPAPTLEQDRFHANCGARECSSYDERFDVSLWFERGLVKVNEDGRLTPFRVVRSDKPTDGEPTL